MGEQIQGPRVERGISKLIVPYEKGELVSVWPPKKPGTYKRVGKEIIKDSLRLQTGYETTLLLGSAYNSEESEFLDVKDKFEKRGLWIYHVNFWLPEKDKNPGVYSLYDSKALGRSMKFNQEELEEKLKGAEVYHGVRINRDKMVAFAPRSTIYLGEEKDWNRFAVNGLNIAIFYPEGAENLSKLGKNNFEYSYDWGVSENTDVEKRVSALDRFYNSCNCLSIDGDSYEDSINFVFGCTPSEKAE